MSEEVKVDELMKMYRSELDRKQLLENEHKAKIKEIDVRLEKLSTLIKAQMDSVGLDTAKTPYGTMTWGIKVHVNISNTDEFFQYVVDNNRFDLVQKRISSTAAMKLIDSGVHIPGTSTYSVVQESFKRK